MGTQMASEVCECGRCISFLYRKSSEHLARELKLIGLSTTQSILLVGIYRNPGINQCNLAESLSMDTAVASRALRALEDQEWLHKEIDSANRRNFKLYLTDQGAEKARQSLGVQERYWLSVLEPLEERQILQMNDTLLSLLESVGNFPDADK